MKRSIVTLSLLAFVIMLTTSYAVTPDVKPEPASCIINYYWFDVTRTWMGRRNTVCDEIFLTGFDEGTHNPKTTQELGWSPANVSLSGNGIPTPITSAPDKVLFSHP
jgi:hypothetical protein